MTDVFFPLQILFSQGGPVFGQPEDSGSEADDEAQMKFYTAHQRGRRRSKGKANHKSA